MIVQDGNFPSDGSAMCPPGSVRHTAFVILPATSDSQHNRCAYISSFKDCIKPVQKPIIKEAIAALKALLLSCLEPHWQRVLKVRPV